MLMTPAYARPQQVCPVQPTSKTVYSDLGPVDLIPTTLPVVTERDACLHATTSDVLGDSPLHAVRYNTAPGPVQWCLLQLRM